MAAGVKTQVYRLLEKGGVGDPLGRWINIVLVFFIIATVVITLLESVPEFSHKYSRLFTFAETIAGLVFLTEYLARLWVADLHPPLRRLGSVKARLRYAIQPASIVDFLAVLPFILGLFLPATSLKALIIIRLTRFLKLARYSPAMRSLINALAEERHALIACFVIIFGVVLVAATGMYLVERGSQPQAFGSIPASMWWALATLTTVGYGDVVPVTTLGKILGGVVMMMGYGLFALPIGIVATAFAREIHSRNFVVTWGMVARVPLFEDLSATEIAEITKLLRAISVPTRDVVTQQGEAAESMYFIVDGAVEVDLGHTRVELEEGAFFGEMAILGRRTRAATVTALQPTNLMVLEASDLHNLMLRNPKLAEKILNEAESWALQSPYGGTDIADEELEQSEPIDDDEDYAGARDFDESALDGEPELFEPEKGGRDR